MEFDPSHQSMQIHRCARHQKDVVKRSDERLPCRATNSAACEPCRQRTIANSFYITVVGLILKGVFGFLCGSRALIADAMHSLADTVCFGINYVGSRSSAHDQARAALRRSCVIGSAIVISGVWVCADNVATLSVGDLSRPGLSGLVVAVVSTCTNWRLWRTSECARSRASSPEIAVCAVQNRTNFFAACLSLLGVLLADAGLVFLDPACALMIGVLMISSGVEILRDSFAERRPYVARVRQNVLRIVGVLICVILSFYGYQTLKNLGHDDHVVLIPAQGTTTASQADTVLGRAICFISINTRTNQMVAFLNQERYARADVSNNLITIVKSQKVDVVLAHNIGVEVFADLRAEGVKMYYFDVPTTVGQAVFDYKDRRLEKATAPNVGKGYGRGEIGWMRPW